MAESISDAIHLFKSRLKSQKFSSETLEILDSVLSSRDLVRMHQIRSDLRDMIRSEAVIALREVSERFLSADRKLCVVQFFVNAFASVGDVESCLALKYEALIMRELNEIGENDLRVSYDEWITFAKDSLDNGFYSIAKKGFESALKCIQSSKDKHNINEIKKLRDLASSLNASHSVQAQSSEYLKRRTERITEEKKNVKIEKLKNIGSILFRNGIKKRNSQKLLISQSCQIMPD